ncbi:M64 family metallopeptidase [Dokdonella fugitiva]|uniref:IgA peptidase M64 n=1 Tax=Dokdonella fugitiva TaxID=328517 RepID=A0A4R2ICT3_9GAMM|nr:M64 family metallopeptidase [Dokdonella fugitiva]TCO40405.1 IgA peptidase M64 [Dokdonella fugitiva]
MERTIARLGLLCGLAGGIAHAAPAHYIVFTRDAAGGVEPVYYAQVELAGARDDMNVRASDDAHGERIAWHAFKDGVDLGERTLAIPDLRGEFARDPLRGDGTIVSAHPRAAARSFVLRIPFGAADAVEFGGAREPQRFDLGALAAGARDLRLAARVPQVEVDRVQGGGSPANRVDMLVVGDGYTNAQHSLFDADAAILHDAFFGLTPYKEYQSFVNWTTAFIASNQSGADHPPYQNGCTQATCCSDPDAIGDVHAGQFVDTAFDATFCAFQIQRLLVVDDGAVLAAAAAYPDWDKIVVVVNDSTYGGSGGDISVTSTHAQAPQIVLHEYGHSFTGLADEYSSPYPGFPPCSDTGGTPCEANVTNQTVAAQVKWNSWFTPGNPIPTPSGTSGVGLFQGARYLTTGMYRPVDTQCLMQFLGVPFCPVCRQEYVRTLYRGGWGDPATGIDLIEPGSESPSTAAPVAYAPGTNQPFSVMPLQPTIGTLGVQWYLDGNPIGGATAATYVFSQPGSTPASHTLQVRVKDQTAFVSAAMAGSLLDHERSWTIQVADDVIFRNGFDGP